MHEPRDVVLCTQVRLVRNYAGLPFPSAMTPEEGAKSQLTTYEALGRAGLDDQYAFIKMSDLPASKRRVLAERGFISLALAKGETGAAALLRKDQKLSLLMNEENHLCIQSTLPGCAVMAASDEVWMTEDAISPYVRYAFDSQFGFLTSNLLLAGTGLRGSVLLHLPAFVRQNKLAALMKEVGEQGLSLHSLYRDDAQPQGELFWLSTRIAMGRTEQEMLDMLEMVAWELVERERKEREALILQKQLSVEDRGMRSYGVLQYARKIDEKEFVRRWSDVRLAILSGILRFPLNRLDALLHKAQNGHLAMGSQKELSAEETDIARAQLIREELER